MYLISTSNKVFGAGPVLLLSSMRLRKSPPGKVVKHLDKINKMKF